MIVDKASRLKDGTGGIADDLDILSTTLQDCIEIKQIAQRITDSSNALSPRDRTKRNVTVQIEDTSVANELHGTTQGECTSGSQMSIWNYIWPRRFGSRNSKKSHGHIMLENLRKLGKKYGDDYSKLHGKQDDAAEDIKKAELLVDIVFLRKGFVVPIWLNQLVWWATVIYLATCAAISLIYGIGYDSDMFVSWLITFLITVVQSMFLVSFITFSIVTVIYTACVKRVHHYLWVPDSSSIARAEAVFLWRIKRKRLHKEKIRRKVITDYNMDVQGGVTSFSGDKISTMLRLSSNLTNFVSKTRYAIAVQQVKRYWKESVSRMLLALFLSILVFSQIEPEFKKTNFTIVNRLRHGVLQIKSHRDIFTYLDNDVLPLLYKTDDTSKDDDTNLLGTIRLRQLRYLATTGCDCFLENTCDCLPDGFLSKPYDQGHYSENWMPTGLVEQNRYASSAWTYHSTPDSEESWLNPGKWLYHDYVSGGGYVADTGYTINEAKAIVRNLEYFNWVDRRTAVFVVDFSTFTLSSGCVTSHLSVIECLPTGSAKAFHQSNAYRPIYVYTWGDIFIISFQLCHFLIVCIQIYLTVAKCVELKWHPLAVLDLCTDLWSVIDIFSYILTITAYVFYIMHIYTSSNASGILYHNPTKFVSFSKPVYYKIMYLDSAAFCIFINYIRLLKIGRGSKAISHVADSIASSLGGLSISSVSFFILIFVFTITGWILLPTSSWSKGSVGTTLMNVCYLATFGSLHRPPSTLSGDVWWKIYFYGAVLCIFVFHSKVIVIVLIRSFKALRKRRNNPDLSPQAETLALHWLYETICRFFGIKSMAFSGKRVSLRAPPGAILHRKSSRYRR